MCRYQCRTRFTARLRSSGDSSSLARSAAYTRNGAVVMGVGDRIGSIEVGKFADFVALDRDVLTCPVDDIRDGRAVLTVLGGEVVWDVR
ncbi:amidohydrolase family protein [Kibdelosporangium lantanae]|uniref:Amidohydrolase family protein n=1 Tax=Kibdelosporangium lantanae TaxID=1497396 RepID=A0ABW3MFP7_9PSEU